MAKPFLSHPVSTRRPGAGRPRLVSGSPGAGRRSPGGRRVRRLVLLTLAGLLALAIAVIRPHRTRPTFEPPVADVVRHVKEFQLRDARGTFHEVSAWRDRPAVVLFALAADGDATRGYAPEMAGLARSYGPRGVAFYGVWADPAMAPEVASRFASEHGLDFPMLLDPERVVTRQAGLRVDAEAAVLTGDGRVLYHGRVDDRLGADGKPTGRVTKRDLRAALDAVLRNEMPAVTATPAPGRPLPQAFTGSRAGPVTFNRDVAPILWRNCASCHRPGEVGPFSLLTYRDAARRAEFIRDVTQDRRMPPWKAQPGYGVFLDSLHLTDLELETLAAWADAGAPEGDPADLPPRPSFPSGWQLGEPDLVFRMPEPYPVPADGQDAFRSFVIPIPIDRDRQVTVFEFRPGNRKVVHHAKLFIDPTGRSRRRDAADPGPGFASLGSADIGQPAIWEWTPGTVPRPAPEGAGWTLKAGSDLVLFVHYHPTGKPETDQSSVGIHLSEAPLRRQIAGIPLATQRIDIPPGAKRHRIDVSATLPADAHAYTAQPHAHYLLREMIVRATLPDGTVERLLWIDDWDFNWQGQFAYARPVALPKGTRIDLEAYFDNSADNPKNPNRPPRRVRFGPASTDEMLGCHFQVIPDDPAGHVTFRKRWPSGF